MRLLALGLLSLLAALPAGATAAERATPGYRFLRVDKPGATTTYLTTVADDGDAVGAFADAAGRFHGLIRKRNGKLRTFDVPGATATYVLGINRHDALAGTYVDAEGHQHGFVRDGKGLRTIDAPEAGFTLAISEFGPGLGTAIATIADDGSVTGSWADENGAAHGFVLTRKGGRRDIDVPGASTASDERFGAIGGTLAIRADRDGAVVGAYVPAERSTTTPVDLRAFLRTPAGRTTTLLPDGMATSQAFGLAEDGTVTGVAFPPGSFAGRGWLWRAGRFRWIDPGAGLNLSTVADVNADGVLTGELVTADGRTHGYLGFPRD